MIMKSITRIARLFIALFICLFLLGMTGLNGQVLKRSVEEMTHDSKTILYGTCTQIESLWDENHERIHTEIRVQAEGYLKGAQGSNIIVTVPGGRVDNILYEVSDMPSFSEGEECVLFLSRHSTGRNLVTGAVQGKLKIYKHPNTGKRLVNRPVKEEASAKKSATIYDETTQQTEAIALDEFLVEISTYLGQ
jgi:hypothetical protein